MIGLIGDYDPEVAAHRAIPQALQLAAGDLARLVVYDAMVANHSLISSK
jgi:hypothetical protein